MVREEGKIELKYKNGAFEPYFFLHFQLLVII
jgi:hypothetical protein